MNKLSPCLLNLIMVRMPLLAIRTLMLIKPFEQNKQFWRIVFFRIADVPIGSWIDACKVISKKENWYIKCYQCGYQTVENYKVPQKCLKCGNELCHRFTALL